MSKTRTFQSVTFLLLKCFEHSRRNTHLEKTQHNTPLVLPQNQIVCLKHNNIVNPEASTPSDEIRDVVSRLE